MERISPFKNDELPHSPRDDAEIGAEIQTPNQIITNYEVPVRNMDTKNLVYPKLHEKIRLLNEYEVLTPFPIEKTSDENVWYRKAKPKHNVLLFSGTPLFIGRFREPFDVRASAARGYSLFQLAEYFVLHLCGKKCEKANNNSNAHVDITRNLKGETRLDNTPWKQALEVKLTQGFTKSPPLMIRGSVAQLNEMSNPRKYAQPSGYVVVSRDFLTEEETGSRVGGIWVYTVWFLPAEKNKWRLLGTSDDGRKVNLINNKIQFTIADFPQNKKRKIACNDLDSPSTKRSIDFRQFG